LEMNGDADGKSPAEIIIPVRVSGNGGLVVSKIKIDINAAQKIQTIIHFTAAPIHEN
jgi:hypothetical protein